LGDIFLLPLDVLALVAAVGSGYYAIRMIIYMRKGRMERAWQYFTVGTILLVVGSIFFSYQDIVPYNSAMFFTSDDLGTAISSAGFLFLLAGFRSLYGVWALKDLQKERQRDPKNSILP
jgi:hypothetical protein